MELAAHIGGQAVQQALHGGDLVLHLGDEILQALGWVRPEEVAVLLHERIEVRLAAGHLLREHLVELADHLLEALHVLGR